MAALAIEIVMSKPPDCITHDLEIKASGRELVPKLESQQEPRHLIPSGRFCFGQTLTIPSLVDRVTG